MKDLSSKSLENLKRFFEENPWQRRLEDLKGEGIVVQLFGDRAIIWDPEKGYKLYYCGFFGKPLGIPKPKIGVKYNVPYELSLYEVLYLLEAGVVKVVDSEGKELEAEAVREIGRRNYSAFDAKYHVYKDLRDKGFIVRPGLKFGSDFSVYKYGPGIDHAPFLVTVYSKDTQLLGIDIIRAGRLATSVRKKFVIATILANGEIKYLVFSWYKL
ncbi:MAG: tRNA-intron lyase [Candidatus Njordarchaeales archaeon]